MKWKVKMCIQNVVSLLPSTLSSNVYYLIQRRFGSLRKTNPVNRLQAGIGIIQRIRQRNLPVVSKTFLEVGTGRQINLPIALWLCGASEIVTVDLNPYLKSELIVEDMAYLRDNRQEIINLFGNYAKEPFFLERLGRLEEVSEQTDSSIDELLNAMSIRYLAPADATALDLPPQSIDYHVSYTVLEHIPPQILARLFREGSRVLKRNGLFVHCIDFSDHFSHSDNSITSINFLKFSEAQWHKYAGNRYMYHNRLRIDEFSALLDEAKVTVIGLEPNVDPTARDALQHGFHPLDARFRDKPVEVNATSSAWVVAAPRFPPDA